MPENLQINNVRGQCCPWVPIGTPALGTHALRSLCLEVQIGERAGRMSCTKCRPLADFGRRELGENCVRVKTVSTIWLRHPIRLLVLCCFKSYETEENDDVSAARDLVL